MTGGEVGGPAPLILEAKTVTEYCIEGTRGSVVVNEETSPETVTDFGVCVNVPSYSAQRTV